MLSFYCCQLFASEKAKSWEERRETPFHDAISWNVSVLPPHLHLPCFSLWCSCPSWLLISLMFPLASFILSNPFRPALLHPLCWSLPLAVSGPTRSAPGQVTNWHRMGWCRCHLEWRPSQWWVWGMWVLCSWTGAGTELWLYSSRALPVQACPHSQRPSLVWGQSW